MRLRVTTAAVLLATAVTGGCGGGGSGEPTPVPSPPLAGCEALTSPPPAVPAAAPTTGAERLPALRLPCLSGGDTVALEQLAGPAVVNLWASWCRPCRDELPVLQRYADRADGRVHVVGVVTEDTRTRAVSFARDAGITFPALHDVDGRLLAGIPAVGLPVTLFVDAGGRISYLHNAQLDEESLVDLAAEHLGVVPP